MNYNPFVDYLNSMNNASGNTIAALAESQVLSEYYEKIYVPRRLGNYISDMIRGGQKTTVVLTGHAGDGKTSILVQVLRELDLLPPNTPMNEEQLYSKGDISLYTVKDMSELPEEKQIAFCHKALEAPLNGLSSIVISNTGPLLKCLENIRQEQCVVEGTAFDEKEKSGLHTMLLEQLDSNKDTFIELGEYKFLMINIARVDNISFAQNILQKLIAEDLWSPCQNCKKRNSCHILFNVEQVRKNYDRLVSFVEAFYRYLYDNDMRMTIRQMLSQLSFSITGNRSCREIKIHNKDVLKFYYLFSNLFFGFRGFEKAKNADQIQGIEYAQELGLDAKALSSDYALFVSGNFECFPFDIRALVEKQHQLFSKRHINIDEKEVFNSQDFEYRKAIRRAFLFFQQAEIGELKYNSLFDELFGYGFNSYMRLQDDNANHKVKVDLEKTILNALYLEMTGTLSKQASDIPITVKRNDNSFQNVMVTTGKLKKSDLKIVTVEADNPFEDNNDKKKVMLRISNSVTFPLSLPIVIYFSEVAMGAISTVANPSLTHGISRLKTILSKYGSLESDEGEISLIVNNTDTPMDLKLYIDDKLYISY